MPNAPTSDQIVDELRWRLSNVNSDLIEGLDISYDAHEIVGEPCQFTLAVSWSDPVRRQYGAIGFRVTVEENS